MARNDKGEVIFDEEEQKKVDAIVQERVARAKAEKPADYDDLKTLNDELNELYPAMTPAQRAAIIRDQKARAAAVRAQQEAAKRADRNGTTPEQEMELLRLREEQESIRAALQAREKEDQRTRAAADEDRKRQARWDSDVAELAKAYPDVDVDKLSQDERFVEYAEGKGGRYTLTQIYERYLKFIGSAADDGIRKARDKETRSTGGGSAGDGRDYGLTAGQKKLLDDWNRENPMMKMTAKELASRL